MIVTIESFAPRKCYPGLANFYFYFAVLHVLLGCANPEAVIGALKEHGGYLRLFATAGVIRRLLALDTFAGVLGGDEVVFVGEVGVYVLCVEFHTIKSPGPRNCYPRPGLFLQ